MAPVSLSAPEALGHQAQGDGESSSSGLDDSDSDEALAFDKTRLSAWSQRGQHIVKIS